MIISDWFVIILSSILPAVRKCSYLFGFPPCLVGQKGVNKTPSMKRESGGGHSPVEPLWISLCSSVHHPLK
jgi:hypothetical protein